MSYSAKSGDTFRRIASIVYGDPEREAFLKAVNPGKSEPLFVGTTLVTPPITVQPTSIPSNVGQDDVTLSIDGEIFNQWTRITIVQSADAVGTFAFETNFEANDPVMREIFTPLQFQTVSIAIGKDQEMLGTMVDVSPKIGDAIVVKASGYARPGVLNDCTIPIGRDLEFYGVGIEEIAKDVCEPYAITPVFKADVGGIFEPSVAATTSQTIWSFLTRLCEQRSVVMTSDTKGQLVFQSEPDGDLSGRLEEGKAPVNAVMSKFEPQSVFSSVTAAGAVVLGSEPQSFTVDNPLIGDVFRPDVFEMRDSFGEELETAARARAGRMYANAAKIEVTVEGWRNSAGNLWQPNTLVSVLAPSVNIVKPYTFLIRSVTRTKDVRGGLQTVLNVTFPGSFSGLLPETLPWTE